jgi:hypothetical protein
MRIGIEEDDTRRQARLGAPGACITRCEELKKDGHLVDGQDGKEYERDVGSNAT